MQLTSDAITVLGSRHGIFLQPCARKCHLIRCSTFPGTDCEIIAGVTINGRSITLPLSGHGESFAFVDQDMTPTAFKVTGIDPKTAVKLELTVTTPFRPRDAEFSTTPVLDISLKLTHLGGNFRWTKPEPVQGKGEIFLEVSCPEFHGMNITEGEIRWEFNAPRQEDREEGRVQAEPVLQKDALVIHEGKNRGKRIVCPFTPENLDDARIHASWCVHSPAILTVKENPAPFKYTERFSDLDEVVEWARNNPDAIRENSEKVDGIFAQNNLSRAVNNLTAQTLHSWLANTWWVKAADKDFFSVWEGSCYYHSTIDVEYTQAPFYLTLWPELLGIELDNWPKYTSPGEEVIGEAGKGTLYFMHDMGQLTACNTTMYHHPMPVEENTNYVLLAYAYWKRSGDFSLIQKHAECISQALDFIFACDTTGNGVADKGMANTIDDASPAVQFGREQVYLAVKSLTAFQAGAEMLAETDHADKIGEYKKQADKILKVVREKGFKDDHFVTLLDPSAEGVQDAWSGRKIDVEQIPGWDATHIYTANGLALFDMLGKKSGLDDEKLRMDFFSQVERCIDKFGCRHSDYVPCEEELSEAEGGHNPRPRIGWISMNMLRDISAFYRGVDLRDMAGRYWEFQVLTNTQGPHLFFETFNGNNLNCYPRGVAVFGFFEAMGGVTIDLTGKKFAAGPFSDQVEVPVLFYADWQNGDVPLVKKGKLSDPSGLVKKD